MLEADLAKRKKLEKKKAKQAKAAAEARVLFQGLQFNTIIMRTCKTLMSYDGLGPF